MELLLVAVLAGALGFTLGVVAGARRALALARTGEALRRLNSQVAPLMPEVVPTRTAADILAGRIRVLLGTTTYELPVLARGPSRRWLTGLDLRFATLAADLDEAGADTPAIMQRLVAETDALYDLLRSYDATGVLPPADELAEVASDAQVLHAVLEVWRAIHPLADTLTAAAAAPTAGTALGQPST